MRSLSGTSAPVAASRRGLHRASETAMTFGLRKRATLQSVPCVEPGRNGIPLSLHSALGKGQIASAGSSSLSRPTTKKDVDHANYRGGCPLLPWPLGLHTAPQPTDEPDGAMPRRPLRLDAIERHTRDAVSAMLVTPQSSPGKARAEEIQACPFAVCSAVGLAALSQQGRQGCPHGDQTKCYPGNC
jgi:hypothetical protein